MTDGTDDGPWRKATGTVPRSILDALAARADNDTPAFTHIDYSANRAGVSHTLTWRDLYVRVCAVAATVREVADPRARVAIVCPQDLSYPVAFLGALAAGMVAVPLFAPEVKSHGERLIGVLGDADPAVWLTAGATLEAAWQLERHPDLSDRATLLAVDRIDHGRGEGFALPDIAPSAIAYLQYTSGSTRVPAGAMITHAALAANVEQVVEAFGVDESWSCVGWLPFFHDMGLVQLVCLPTVTGAQSIFSAPFDFVRRPLSWLTAMSDRANVMTAAPNFAFDYAVERTEPADRERLDLSGVRVAINGSEPVRPRTVERFQATFGEFGFDAEALRPCYGLAEATVFVSATDADGPKFASFARSELSVGRAVRASEDDGIELVGAGVPVGQLVCIADPETGVLKPDGDVGEIWIHGPNVASGYWRQPERSREVFGGVLSGGGDGLPVVGWLRTGDLGTFADGALFITGRLKDLIIVDGKNHYPQDIEETVQHAHPAIRPGRVAAFGISTNGIPAQAGEGVVVVLERMPGEAGEAVTAQEISLEVRRAVASAHDLRLHDVDVLDGLNVLRTSSGKIARGANRDRYLAGLRG